MPLFPRWECDFLQRAKGQNAMAPSKVAAEGRRREGGAPSSNERIDEGASPASSELSGHNLESQEHIMRTRVRRPFPTGDRTEDRGLTSEIVDDVIPSLRLELPIPDLLRRLRELDVEVPDPIL